MTPRSLRLAAMLLAAVPAAVRAQTPEQRAVVEAFRDSIAGTRDTVGLRALEQRLIAQAKADRDNAALHLRLGFLALRLGDLGGPSHYDDAASEFQWVIDLHPDWPYGWYGMGFAELGLGDSKVSLVAGLQTMFGKDALTRSAAAFARSAEVEPSFVRGLVELANTALRQRVNIRLTTALDALRRAGATEAGRNPAVLLARGRVEREAGDPDSALAAFRAFVAAGADTAAGRYELARTRLWRGDTGGVEDYLAAAASNDSAVVAGLRSDLAPIVSDSVLREFDGLRGAARAQYLRQFWSTRDAADLRRPGERLAEHYRRYFYARRNFMLVSPNRQYDIAERYRSGSRDFDDRGIIYLRHGEPTLRASLRAASAERSDTARLEANESWRYVRADGDLVFHFVAREDVQDYRLVESLLDALGYSNAIRLQSTGVTIGTGSLPEQLLASREQFAPIYQRMLTSSRVGFANLQAEERLAGRRNIVAGTSSDDFEPGYRRSLDVECQALGVGHAERRPLLHLACGVGGRSLVPLPVPEGLVYALRVRLAVLDSLGRVVASADTTRRYLAGEPVPPGEYVVSLLSVPVIPGRLTVRVAAEQGDSVGAVLPRQFVEVPAPGPAGLVLSDLVLGNRSSHLAWRPAPGDTVFFNPLRRFRREEPMELYYEIEGATEGATYATVVAVRKGKSGKGFLGLGSGSTELKVKFEDRAPAAPVWRTARAIDVSRLKPGDYSLELTLTGPDGRAQVRRQPFRIAP